MTDEADVPIEFKGKHDHISERMKEHATDKIAKLARFQDWLTRIEVVADHVHENPEVELIVHLRKGAPIVSKERAASFSATVDLVVDKVETLLRKLKEKVSDRKTHAGRTSHDVPQTGGGPEEETYEEIVRKELRK